MKNCTKIVYYYDTNANPYFARIAQGIVTRVVLTAISKRSPIKVVRRAANEAMRIDKTLQEIMSLNRMKETENNKSDCSYISVPADKNAILFENRRRVKHPIHKYKKFAKIRDNLTEAERLVQNFRRLGLAFGRTTKTGIDHEKTNR